MKASSTIRKQLTKIKKLQKSLRQGSKQEAEADAVKNTLAWVLCSNSDWTPESLIER